MPKLVFQKLGIREAKKTTVMLQLADHSKHSFSQSLHLLQKWSAKHQTQERLPARFDNLAARELYDRVVAAKHIWDEQGFKFDDGLDFYGLETVIYQTLFDQGWLKFGRHPASANLNWVREFYAHNATGENTMVNVRG
ncbi:hypothetical protein V6N13_007672 [Hibiscus sabdariffa]